MGPNFGPILMKLGPVVCFTKKMTLYKCGPVSSPNYGETAVCSLGRKGNKRPKHCPVVAGTWLGSRSALFFFAQNFRILARKSVFCYRTSKKYQFFLIRIFWIGRDPPPLPF